MSAALLAAWILAPSARAQANPTPGSKAWSVAGKKRGRLCNISFSGGPIGELKQLWTNVFTNDNLLIGFSDNAVELPAFQMRDMTLPELARSFAFVSKGGLTVDVVERDDSLPGNILRVARPTREAMSHSVTMRAVAAPHLFANEETPKRLFDEARQVQRNLMIVQQGYLRVARHVRPFTSEGDFWNWLCCGVRCASVDHGRKTACCEGGRDGVSPSVDRSRG